MRLSPGKHHVQVIGASLTASSTGTMGIRFDFENDDGTIDHTLWVTERTVDRVRENLATLGYSSQLFDDPANLDRIQEITLGNECQMVVEDEEYKGKIESKVKWINALGRNGLGRGSVATPGMRDRLHAMLTGKPAPLVSQPREPQAMPLSDDDLPF